MFDVDFSGADHFLAWAMVSIYLETEEETRHVVYEGAPGAALGQVTSLCTGGFDEDVPPTTVTAVIPIRELCDDGNDIDLDGCNRDCTIGGPP